MKTERCKDIHVFIFFLYSLKKKLSTISNKDPDQTERHAFESRLLRYCC